MSKHNLDQFWVHFCRFWIVLFQALVDNNTKCLISISKLGEVGFRKKGLKTEFSEYMKDWNSSKKCNSGRFKRNAFSQNEKVEFLGLVYHWLRFRFRFQEAEQKKLKSSFSRPVPGRWRPKHWLGDILGSAPSFLPSLLEPAGGGLFLRCRFVDSAGIAEFS